MSEYRVLDEIPANWTRAVWSSEGNLVNLDDPFKWSGSIENDPPAIGSLVKAYVNSLGTGTILSYFVEEGWLGMLVKLDNPPDWYIKQNGANKPCHLFGRDLEPFKRKVQ